MAINKNKVMDAGRKAYEKGQYDKAIKEFLKIVKEDPQDVRVWLKIGDLYAKKGDKSEATETYLKVAEFYSEQGFYLKAVAVYKQILKVDPRLVEVNLKLAELYRQLGLLSDAAQHFEMVAAFFQREGKAPEAMATLRQLVELDPENVATRIKLAELYSKEEMLEEAIAEFATTCDYLRRAGRQDDFIKVAERLLFHAPEDMPLCRELATLYLRRNDPRRALAKLQVCFKADQNDPTVLALLAQAFQRLDQKGKTVSVLKELARVHLEAGKRKDAQEVHEKILQYVPGDPDSMAFLGRSAPTPSVPPRAVTFGEAPPETMGRSTGSVPLVDPDTGSEVELRESEIIELQAGSEDFVADLDLEEEPVSYDPEGSVVESQANADEIVKILTETDVYVKYGLHQKAIEHLRRVFQLDPRNVEARERLQDIYLKEGREEDAMQELLTLAEHTISSNPEKALSYVRQILATNASNQQALAFAERHRLDVGSGTFAPADDSSGHLAPVEELDFDDLAFDDLSMGRPADAGSEVDDVVYEFDSEDVRRPATMEVDLGQVEAVAMADSSQADSPDEFEFELEEDGDAIEFDAADAAAFDAEPGFEGASASPYQEEAGAPVYSSNAEESEAPSVPGYPEDIPTSGDIMDELPELDLGDLGDVTELPTLGQAVETSPDVPLDADPPATTALEDDLDEADFFLSQGLFDEARDMLKVLAQRYPNHPLVAAKLEEVETESARASDGVGLLDDLDSSGLDGAVNDAFGGKSPASHTSPSVVLERPVAEDDADTHFDLGLAYKEMGLHNEAILAFEKVMESSTAKEVQCRLMVGLCHREQGALSEAISQFKAGLYVEGISEPEKYSLYYEIGLTYEGLQDPQEALYYYEMVSKKEPTYRDVAHRVRAIKGGDQPGV